MPVSQSSIIDLSGYATLASPAFTGTPTVPTPTADAHIANKGYVDTQNNGTVNKIMLTSITGATITTAADCWYRKFPDGTVEWSLDITMTASGTETVIFQFPAGYRPLSTMRFVPVPVNLSTMIAAYGGIVSSGELVIFNSAGNTPRYMLHDRFSVR